MKKSIFVDIDGTLADLSHRVHHLSETPDGSQHKDWDAFYRDIHKDRPINPMIDLVRSLHRQEWFIILITGRDAGRRDVTEDWLKRFVVPWDALLMRPLGNHAPDVQIKRAWLNKMRDGELVYKGVALPELVLEDRRKVVDMWREEGLIALHCDEGDF